MRSRSYYSWPRGVRSASYTWGPLKILASAMSDRYRGFRRSGDTGRKSATQRQSRLLLARCRGRETQAALGIQRDPVDAEPLGQKVRQLGAGYLGDL
jgi:hypothetical protein